MKPSSLMLAVVLPIVAASIACMRSAEATPAPAQLAADSAAGDFDFLIGDWRVHHRRIQADTRKWVEFDGTCSTRKIMDGAGNMEEHMLSSPSGAYRAVGLRAYDPASGQWAIWWLDGRSPSRPLDPPVRGSFDNGVGTFYSDYMAEGKPMRGRFIWSHITPTSARWEQALSADNGKTWETNWIMEFERVADTATHSNAPTNSTATSGPRDFDFLSGEWRVRHRYLRVQADRRDWVELEGTCRNRALMEGAANLEEHVFNTTAGTSRGLALRAYDPKTARWSIWWLDGRTPTNDLGPPVEGHFDNGVGTFYADVTLDGKPVRTRFIWSNITATSARWEQAYSSDAGKTWETNWVMEFQRVS
jgi:hypothetical protein